MGGDCRRHCRRRIRLQAAADLENCRPQRSGASKNHCHPERSGVRNNHCHPERSCDEAKRSHSGVEGPCVLPAPYTPFVPGDAFKLFMVAYMSFRLLAATDHVVTGASPVPTKRSEAESSPPPKFHQPSLTYENIFRIIIMQFIDAHSFDLRT